MMIQDLKETIDEIKDHDGFEPMAYDFFTPQPVKGRNIATALHDALSGRLGTVRAHDLRVRARLRLVILDVDVCGHERLPDTVQIWMTVNPGRSIRRKLP